MFAASSAPESGDAEPRAVSEAAERLRREDRRGERSSGQRGGTKENAPGLYLSLCVAVVYGHCVWPFCVAVVSSRCVWPLCLAVVCGRCV